MATSPSLYSLLDRGLVLKADLLPDEIEEDPKKRDWVKITAIVVLVLAGLVAAFAGLSLSGMFPVSIFGGTHNALFTLFGAGIVAACGGGVFYYKWKNPADS